MELEKATLAAGCFWGVEYVYRRVPGVLDVQVGYAGGRTPNPTYEQVCSHTTGHAEVAQVTFDPRVVTFEQLLEVFWAMHDPTQVDRQGPDVGDQYRSEVFTHTPEQGAIATSSKERAEGRIGRPVATKITPLVEFWPGEDYHQEYYTKTGHEPYCHTVPTKVLAELGLITTG